MDKIYGQLNKESFKKSAILAIMIGDIALIAYLYNKFSDKVVFQKSLDLVLQTMPDARNQLPPDFQQQLYSMMMNALVVLLTLVFVYHLFVNFLWFKDSYVARGYLKLYAWTAGPLCSLSGVLSLVSSPLFGLFFLFVGAVFLYVAIGMGYFPEENPRSKPPTRPRKKSAR